MNRISVNDIDCKNCSAKIVAPKSIEICDEAVPEILPNEILIKMEGCGVCGSNLASWQGRSWFCYPMEAGAPGHEGWGIVYGVGKDVSKFKIGDRVTALSMHAFATFDKIDQNSAVLIPPELNDMPFPGEALGCAMNVFKRSGIVKGQNVAIIGIGFLGALLCQLISNEGANIVAISRRKFALDIAQKCGVSYCYSFDNLEETVNNVNRIFPGGCDCVIEATGFQKPINLASELVRIGGKLIIAGYHQDGLRQINLQQWNWKGIDVINAHERNPDKYIEGIMAAIDATIKKRINPSMLFSHLIPINQIEMAFKLIEERPDGFMKALVTI